MEELLENCCLGVVARHGLNRWAEQRPRLRESSGLEEESSPFEPVELRSVGTPYTLRGQPYLISRLDIPAEAIPGDFWLSLRAPRGSNGAACGLGW
jgi:hypothetical protein